MKQRKTFVLFLALSLTNILQTTGQTNFEVPENITLQSKEDYPKYELAMIDAAKWLEETDLNKESDKRKQVNAFVIQLVSGSPNINVEIGRQLSNIYGKNIQLLSLYLASYARHFLENKGTATKFTATKAGLIAMMKVYIKGIEISKSKEMEQLIKRTNDNKLDDYINTKFK